jgi:hypothetical protein
MVVPHRNDSGRIVLSACTACVGVGMSHLAPVDVVE